MKTQSTLLAILGGVLIALASVEVCTAQDAIL
jgi:hypothetical protein